ncbi:very short patch repair endonuclease [Pseudoduganella sp.]|uniref:very short patch repair endonuclease n=1 Tax=Pseudoduganella sp. TaxID=1880898 RepID=UPI0035B0BFC3
MADIVDPSARSRMMAGIRGKDTKPELFLRQGLHRLGLRYRLHCRDMPGRPDLVFPKYRVALFVHGCYWHRHQGCRLCSVPAQNSEFWREKFERNMSRDKRQFAELREAGWRVLIIWECVLRRKEATELFVSIAGEIRDGKSDFREWPARLKLPGT